MFEFIGNAASASLTAAWLTIITYWMDWDFMGAMFALNTIAFGAIAIGGCLIAGMLWVKRHVRIAIV